MTSKRFAVFIGLLLASTGVLGQVSTTYPEKKGIVNDYAGKLTGAQTHELANLIQQYERQTSIEFAVVIVDDLQGRSAREYAIGVGDAWGVGKAGRNNGIVLLWAPRERSYSLRIAEGLTADISDSDAAGITQQNLLPNFKRGEYYTGLKETVRATMAHLGDKSWEERVQARAQAVEQRRQDEERRSQEQAKKAAATNRAAGGTLLFSAFVVVIGIVIYKWKQRRERLADLTQAGPAIADDLRKAEGNAGQVGKLLDDFAKESPEQDITTLRADLAGQLDRVVKIRLDATLLDFAKLESYEEMVRLKARAAAEPGLLGTIQQKIRDIRSAKQRSQALMDTLSRETFEISKVRDSSKTAQVNQLLSASREEYEQARRNSSMSVVDWLLIDTMLDRSHSQIQQAVAYSQEEPYVSSFNSSGSGSSSFSSSSSGGGGGFSSGSGSDGSY